MKLFPQDDKVVLYETAFDDDLLSRSDLSEQLSGLVGRISDPMVLALDDRWGSGKTYFLKRWVAAHTSENSGTGTTIYFDAFENDYLSDPLVSIIFAIGARLSNAEGKTLQKWKDVGARLVRPAFGVALSFATFGAKKHLEEIGDVLVDAASAEIKGAADQLWAAERDRKEAMVVFKETSAQMAASTAGPIIVVVDELDRCRPDYALSVLEIIKHFFAVESVHFILGINGKVLEDSVRARYGVDIDAEGYLRKFINVSFSLPRMIKGGGDRGIVEHYAAESAKNMKLEGKVVKRCIDLIGYAARGEKVSLRDVGKILSKIALLPDEVSRESVMEGRIDILCFLLVTSVISPRLHLQSVAANASIEDLREFMGILKENTIDRLDDNDCNSKYDHDATVWLATIIFCCSSASVDDDEHIRFSDADIERRFDSFGLTRSAKAIPRKIQMDWVEVFKLQG